jgi:hypothetical protein
VEISSHYPHYASQLLTETEDQLAGGKRPDPGSETKVTGEAPAGDRLNLVRTQNLASPLEESVDLTRAAELLRRVQEQMPLLQKEEAGELYRFDRLRDLLYRVSQPESV